MGVKGLLPLLRSIQKPCSLKQFSGQTLGVDAYGWLHRGTVACAIELAQGKPTTKFVDFAISRCRMLVHFGVTPLLVFDGDYLPSKKHTEKDRAARRRASKAAGLELLQMGRSAQAYQELQKAIDVTPEMARQFMDELDKAKIRFIVAPYEADSQLVYLEKEGIINGILSEDSDMLVFGAKTLLTKLDQYGECVAIHRKDFTACKEISLVGWSDAEFRTMSILSGCDYLAPIGNVGLKTAYRLIRKHKTVDRIVKALQFDGKSKVPPTYLEDFRTAEATFLYQWVYCPEARKLINITEPPASVDVSAMSFIGPKTPDDIARRVAAGQIHPHTHERLLAPPLPTSRPFKTLDKALQQTRTPELKKHHSIESFFKAKRTPLAELDPNCFTPSPSQQRLLEQQQEERAWQPAPAPIPASSSIRPPVLARAVTDVERSQSARRAMSDMTPNRGNTSPKRQRLCADSAVAFGAKSSIKVATGQSKFFTKPAMVSSPSVLKASRKTSTRKAAFDVWSDDSIEDAMASLADPSVPTPQESMKKRLEVFRDEPEPLVVSQTTTVDSQSSVETQTSIASIDNPTFSQDDQESTLVDVSFQPLDQTAFEVDLTPADPVQSKEAAFESVPCSSPQAPPQEDEITETDWAAAAKVHIVPLSIKKEFELHPRDDAVGGSEDLIVPQSDSEEDAIGGAAPERPTFGLNLGRFAFAG